MEELQQLQSMRLKLLLKEKNINQKKLAEKLGVSPTSVSHWVNGKAHMNDYNASQINKEYPEYSVEYLRGYAEFPNEMAALRETRNQHMQRFYTELECVEGLLKLNGVDVEYYSEHVDAAGEYTIIIDAGESFVKSDRYDEFAMLGKDGHSVSLTIEQWRAFRREIVGYVELRINSMLERGCW